MTADFNRIVLIYGILLALIGLEEPDAVGAA